LYVIQNLTRITLPSHSSQECVGKAIRKSLPLSIGIVEDLLRGRCVGIGASDGTTDPGCLRQQCLCLLIRLERLALFDANRLHLPPLKWLEDVAGFLLDEHRQQFEEPQVIGEKRIDASL